MAWSSLPCRCSSSLNPQSPVAVLVASSGELTEEAIPALCPYNTDLLCRSKQAVLLLGCKLENGDNAF